MECKYLFIRKLHVAFCVLCYTCTCLCKCVIYDVRNSFVVLVLQPWQFMVIHQQTKIIIKLEISLFCGETLNRPKNVLSNYS